MKKLCPFRKTTIYDNREDALNYNFPHKATEEFEECVGEACMAYKYISLIQTDACYLIGNATMNSR